MRRSGEWGVTSGEKERFFGRLIRHTSLLSSWHLTSRVSKNCKIPKLTEFRVRRAAKKSGSKAAALQIAASLLMYATCSGCGYHVAGKSSTLPKSIHVIAVPALENKTTVYRIEQRLTAATVHEFLAKTQYRIVPDPANADAVLRGKVLSLEAVPLLFDTATGRATTMLVTVKCEVTLEERETGKIFYHTDNFVFRNQYEIASVLNPATSTVDPTTVTGFFQEQDPALDRLAQDFAARLVAAVMENY